MTSEGTVKRFNFFYANKLNEHTISFIESFKKDPLVNEVSRWEEAVSQTLAFLSGYKREGDHAIPETSVVMWNWA